MNQLVCAYMSGFINKIGKTPSVRERAVDDYSREHREEDSKSNITKANKAGGKSSGFRCGKIRKVLEKKYVSRGHIMPS